MARYPAARAMNYDFPIQQLVRWTGAGSQLGFASEARERLPQSEAWAVAASRRGLHVLARNEDELAAPVIVLREAYGALLEVGPPAVRLIRAARVQEPVMHVRISLDVAHRDAVKEEMAVRRAAVEEDCERGGRAVLRYEAPLARLLGLPAKLRRLTEGTARYWIVLSHYAPVAKAPLVNGEA